MVTNRFTASSPECYGCAAFAEPRRGAKTSWTDAGKYHVGAVHPMMLCRRITVGQRRSGDDEVGAVAQHLPELLRESSEPELFAVNFPFLQLGLSFHLGLNGPWNFVNNACMSSRPTQRGTSKTVSTERLSILMRTSIPNC